MRKIFFVIMFFLFLPGIINAYELENEWVKSFGGNKWDTPSNIIPIDNESFLVFGAIQSTDIDGIIFNESTQYMAFDSILVNYNNDGEIIWKKSWGGNGTDYFVDSILTSDDEILVVGYSNSTNIDNLTNNGETDAIFIKYDTSGNILWQKSFGGNKSDTFNAIKEVDDGYIVVGSSDSTNIDDILLNGRTDGLIIKYDKDGNVVWQKNYGGSDYDEFSDLLITDDGSYLSIGKTYSSNIGNNIVNNGVYDIIMVKYDSDGNIKWEKNFGGNDNDYVYDVISSGTDFIILISYTSTDIEGHANKGSWDSMIIKFDKDGKELWKRSFGGSGADVFTSLLPINTKEFLVLGRTSSTDIEGIINSGKDDASFLRYDMDGNEIGKSIFGGSGTDSFETAFLKGNSIFSIGYFTSTDIDGLNNRGTYDIFVSKYFKKYSLNVLDTEYGTSTALQKSDLGIIESLPNEGYEVDKIIVKNTKDEIIEVTALEDGTYSFPLSDDVTIEVLFKEVLLNPKTGVFDYISFILIGLLISVIGYISISYNNQKNSL